MIVERTKNMAERAGAVENRTALDASKPPSMQQGDPLKFVKDLATYYMDFLETDFHRRKNPKRSVRFRNADNLLVGINIARYPPLERAAWNVILSGFSKNTLSEIRKGAFRATFPEALLQVIILQSDKISDEQMEELRAAIGSDILQLSRTHRADYDRALATTIEAVGIRVRTNLLSPFITHIRRPLEGIGIGDADALAEIEQELCDLIQQPGKDKISEIVRKLITDTPLALGEELRPLFCPDAIRRMVVEFFANFAVGDVFLELYELQRNKSILDKQELYLYFCDISYDGSKYPIFYIPLATSLKEDRLAVEFDTQVYLNKRALEYIVQNENERTGKKGSLSCTRERIVYLAQQEEKFAQFVSGVMAELQNFFLLDRPIDPQDWSHQVSKSATVRLSNSCYISLSDNADEALLNDYEQILQLLSGGCDSAIAGAFKTLVDDFIHRDPDSVAGEVQDDWEALGVPDRLVYESPVPLNGEQRQILMALQKERCKYVTVEGPPGTGKSHTITAIVCNSVLNNQSVLVLSDKKEALDVVERKITSTLNQVRKDKKFQNPILRLGSTGSTYAQILSASVMEDIRAHYTAVKKQHEAVQQSITSRCAGLKEDIEAEAIGYEDIPLTSVMEWATLESKLDEGNGLVDFRELLAHDDAATDLEDLFSIAKTVQEFGEKEFSGAAAAKALGLGEVDSVHSLVRFFRSAASLEGMLKRVEKAYPSARNDLGLLRSLSQEDVDELSTLLRRYAALRKPLIGFLLSRRQTEALDRDFRAKFGFMSPDAPHNRLADIQRIWNVAAALRGEIPSLPSPIREGGFALCQMMLTQPEQRSLLRRIVELAEVSDRLPGILSKYPLSMARLGISEANVRSLGINRLTAQTSDDFAILVRYVTVAQQLRQAFHEIPEVNYSADQNRIHDLVTVYMTYLMDGRVLEFYEKQRNTAKSLRDIIRSKQRFPQAEFLKLKEAFPCILAGVRDYAEYIPLEPETFDLLVIDEASQVSVAQAFPALLRAKKILILGDKRQFSNVKAIQARTDTNREYMNRLEASFRQNISRDRAKLLKLERFSIRTSILEFFEFISNYHAQLLKHFRGYKELISYSNENFYRGKLQVMKVRGKQIDEVIRFTVLPSSSNDSARGNKNVNRHEAQFIVSELLKLRENRSHVSVGIITPHTDQQKLLVDTVGKLPEQGYFYNESQLKIMTFDTCQGEERDLIFYSMVADGESDKLWGVFIKDLASVDLEEDGKLKAQRLNVGFSRAKEGVHFVVSKPLDGYKGAIGEALRHFWRVRDEAKKEHTAADVDPRSGREGEVLNWFYQTRFWHEEKDRCEFTPQFDLGKYLKQLDPRYEFPEYRVDFLLLHRPNPNTEAKIIIEYDGFREHFGDATGIDSSNYSQYYSEEDVYRQKVLESYGYRFLRINRLNLGDDPIATLDARLRKVTDGKASGPHDAVLEAIRSDIGKLQDGGLKECPKCKELRDIEAFKDPSLASGVGRFCRSCKTVKSAGRKRAGSSSVPDSPAPNACPKCGSRMVLRSGRFGRFYGCSRYPYCRATRPFRQAPEKSGTLRL